MSAGDADGCLQDVIAVEEYMFRHDRGAFFFGSLTGMNAMVMCCCAPKFTTESLYRELHSIDDDGVLTDFIVQVPLTLGCFV